MTGPHKHSDLNRNFSAKLKLNIQLKRRTLNKASNRNERLTWWNSQFSTKVFHHFDFDCQV